MKVKCDVCEEVTDFETNLTKYLGINYLCKDCYMENRQDWFFCSHCKRFFKIEDIEKEYPHVVEALEEYEIEDQFICEDCAKEFKKYAYDLTKSGVLEAYGIEQEEDDSFYNEDYYY